MNMNVLLNCFTSSDSLIALSDGPDSLSIHISFFQCFCYSICICTAHVQKPLLLLRGISQSWKKHNPRGHIVPVGQLQRDTLQKSLKQSPSLQLFMGLLMTTSYLPLLVRLHVQSHIESTLLSPGNMTIYLNEASIVLKQGYRQRLCRQMLESQLIKTRSGTNLPVASALSCPSPVLGDHLNVPRGSLNNI